MDQLVEMLFNRMDDWRHFPDYQLERRADILFSLYLPTILSQKLGKKISEHIIPEFPFLIDPKVTDKESNQSKKVDFLAFTDNFTEAFYVELKTDSRSVVPSQRRFYEEVVNQEFTTILKDVVTIFNNTDKNARMKYFHLLRQLEKLRLLVIPDKLKSIMGGSNHRGYRDPTIRFTYNDIVKKRQVVYIQPSTLIDAQPCHSENNTVVITFDEVANSIRDNHLDHFSQRFAESVRRWGFTKAGAQLREELISATPA